MSVALCVLRIEIDEDLPDMGDTPVEIEAAKEQKKKDRGARESRTITVETYASIVGGPNSVPGILPTSSRKSPRESSVSEEPETISFFCGNPLVEVTKGILHLYKENELREKPEAKMLCLLSVPGALGANDLLAFAAACQEDIAHVRVLRDGSPDHYMALLTFRTTAAAREFHAAFDGVPYSSLEPSALCRIAWVCRVESTRDGAAPPHHTELPTCPVCLERMDESVAGVLSVQCAHTFHAECLSRWNDERCPVCRCAQTPDQVAGAHCAMCLQQEEEEGTAEADESRLADIVGEGLLDVQAGALWICLVCGHVGCGRYERGHAAKHFLQSNHTYALQLGSNRVWDYAGDNFVHRLVQNKTDGKLVAAEGGAAGEEACGSEKLDSAQLEFTYILTQQLDTQRNFYQERIQKLEADHKQECEKLRAENTQLKERVDTLTNENKSLNKKLQEEKKGLEKKLHHVTTRLASLAGDLAQERNLGAALARSHAEWQAKAQVTEQNLTHQVAELKEQLRDVMFYVEARQQLEKAEAVSSEEIKEASVSVGPPAKPRRRRNKNNAF